jgi:hypothetical protein
MGRRIVPSIFGETGNPKVREKSRKKIGGSSADGDSGRFTHHRVLDPLAAGICPCQVRPSTFMMTGAVYSGFQKCVLFGPPWELGLSKTERIFETGLISGIEKRIPPLEDREAIMNRLGWIALAAWMVASLGGCVDLYRTGGVSLETLTEDHLKQPWRDGYRYGYTNAESEAVEPAE